MSISPRDEATAIISHYLHQLTLATGRRWTAANAQDMVRLNSLMAEIADTPSDVIPPYSPAPAQPRTTVVLERDPADEDMRYQDWRRERADDDEAAARRMLGSRRNGNGHG